MEIIDLGKSSYEDALRLQKKLFGRKLNNRETQNFLIITEHFPVYTCGKTAKKEHIINIPEDIPVFETERGGSVTFHGEGQIVVYPIFDLSGGNVSVKKFVWILEEIMISTLREIGIYGFRMEKLRGVFTPKGKIGFVGVKVSRFISYHGFSLNVNVDKKFFASIIPCGIKDIPVCNISDFVSVDTENVKSILIRYSKNLLGE